MTPAERELVFRKALEAFRRGRLNLAADGFRELIDDGTDTPIHLSYAGLLEVRCHGRKRYGLELCGRALVLSPNDPQIHRNLARVYRMVGQMERARATLRRGLRVCPGHPVLLADIERIDARRRPSLPVLSRDNPLNRVLGKIRSRLAAPVDR